MLTKLSMLRRDIKYWRLNRAMRARNKAEIARVHARIMSRIDQVVEASAESTDEERATLLRDVSKANEQDKAHLTSLIQQETRIKLEEADIEIPTEYLVGSVGGTNILTREGQKWARTALRKHQRENVEFWMKLVVPILSLILSIIALYVAAHKR